MLTNPVTAPILSATLDIVTGAAVLSAMVAALYCVFAVCRAVYWRGRKD